MENDFTKAKEARAELAINLYMIANKIKMGRDVDMPPHLLAALLNEGANEIQDAEKYRIPADGKYLLAINAYREQLMEALEIANDPFKASELVVHTSTSVMAAAWDMQVEYAAMVRLEERRRKGESENG